MRIAYVRVGVLLEFCIIRKRALFARHSIFSRDEKKSFLSHLFKKENGLRIVRFAICLSSVYVHVFFFKILIMCRKCINCKLLNIEFEIKD